jgi:ligand-binding sensor protein
MTGQTAEKKVLVDDNRLLNELSLTDYIGKDELQKLQDAFAKANKIASTIVDISGVPITQPSNHSRVCAIVRQTQKGFENCIRSGKNLGLISLEKNQACFHKCQGVGFMDASAPIVIEGVHVANWLMGQNWIGDADADQIVSYAEKIGADPVKLLEAFHDMPKISETEFKEKLDFLFIMANQISVLAYKNLKYTHLIASLEKSNKELEGYKNNLEAIVEERTSKLKIVSGLLPICMHCKKIRDDKGYWNQIEAYISDRSEAEFSHSICQKCLDKYYPEDLDDENEPQE